MGTSGENPANPHTNGTAGRPNDLDKAQKHPMVEQGPIESVVGECGIKDTYPAVVARLDQKGEGNMKAVQPPDEIRESEELGPVESAEVEAIIQTVDKAAKANEDLSKNRGDRSCPPPLTNKADHRGRDG